MQSQIRIRYGQTFQQLLEGCLQYNSNDRWTPKQALSHSFVTGESYDEDFRPIPDDYQPSASIRAPPSPMRTHCCSSASSTRSTPPRSTAGGASSLEVPGRPGRYSGQRTSPSGTPSSSRNRTPLMNMTKPGPGNQPLQTPSAPGSQPMSPWHLPSPAQSQRSTVSHASASQANSGSESYGAGALNLDECESRDEDMSHSDTPGSHWLRSAQASVSDCNTPQNLGRPGGYPSGRASAEGVFSRNGMDIQQKALFELEKLGKPFIPDLSRSGAPAASGGASGAAGNFREVIGMTDTGPVTFPNQGSRRDPRQMDGSQRGAGR